jgi:NTP pyrophosphatase (non-canonical NTP hydrolase)
LWENIFEYVEIFVSNNYSYIAWGIIVLAALYSYVRYDLCLLLPLIRSLKGKIKRLEEINGSGTGNVENIRQLFNELAHPVLDEAWDKYEKGLQNKDMAKGLKAEQIFNEQTMLGDRMLRKKAEAVPGILISMGILGTFAVAAVGISGIDLSGSASVESSINVLLEAVALSFAVSAAGIACSVIFNLLDGHSYQKVLKYIKTFCSLIDNKIRGEKHEKHGMGFSEIEGFVLEKLVPVLTRSYSESINNVIVPAIDKLTGMISVMEVNMGKDQEEGIKAMADSFLNGLNNVLSEELKGLGENMNEEILSVYNEYVEKTGVQVQRMQEDLNFGIENIFSRFNETSGAIFDRMEKNTGDLMERMQDNISSLMENMDEETRNISLYAKELTSDMEILNEKLESSVDEFGTHLKEGILNVFEGFDQGLAEISTRFEKVIMDIRDTVDHISDVMLKIKE